MAKTKLMKRARGLVVTNNCDMTILNCIINVLAGKMTEDEHENFIMELYRLEAANEKLY